MTPEDFGWMETEGRVSWGRSQGSSLAGKVSDTDSDSGSNDSSNDAEGKDTEEKLEQARIFKEKMTEHSKDQEYKI